MAKQHIISVSTRWDRPAVATGRGETWLVVSIAVPAVTSRRKRPPVDVAFVIDRSGSMSGPPLDLAKQGVIAALDQLGDADALAVVAYDDKITTISPLAAATSSHRARIASTLREVREGGSTNLFGGWMMGCEHLDHPGPAAKGRVRRVILLTDGLANVGLLDPQQISHHVSRERVAGVATSTLGLGTGFDETLLSGMAEAGGGNFAFAQDPRDLPAFFARELGEALSVVASSAKVRLTLPKGVRARLLNPFPSERKGKEVCVEFGDLPAGMTLDLVFSVTTRATDEGPLPPLHLEAEWIPQTGDGTPGTAVIERPVVDPLMVVDPRAFATMPRDETAAAAVSRVVANDARREALRHYRVGDAVSARSALRSAQAFAMSAPVPDTALLNTLEEEAGIDPNSAAFRQQSRTIEAEAHRRNRGRSA
jgi:Ca-activated chloride channel family protein